MRLRPLRSAVLCAAASVASMLGCATVAPISVYADRYRIEAAIDPIHNRLSAQATVDLTARGLDRIPPGGLASFEILLHPELRIKRIRAAGGRVLRYGRVGNEGAETSEFSPARYAVVLDSSAETFTLFVEYRGELAQNVAAGEQPGRIHNREMRAHIGTDGIYLADGYWYPRPARHPDAPPSLADYALVVDRVPGLTLAAGAHRDPIPTRTAGRLAWKSPFPLDGLVLVGGPHDVHHTRHRDVAIRAHLKPSQAHLAEGWLNAVRRILDRYEPLIGPYPAAEYAVVDNFFSSGFAFPTFTLLSSAVIEMGERAQTTHGYLDHEMLHCWWGNGVFVDPRDGNWSEALASYTANYYGHVLDGDEDEARRKRRNFVHFLSRIDPTDDKPLGTYGRPEGCGRKIAYDKGAAVFHMLARKIGQDNFWSAMRALTAGFVGRYASWDDIRRVCERAGGVSLEGFFEQWVRRGGAPMVQLEFARFDSAASTLALGVSQSAPPFDFDLPVRVHFGDGHTDTVVVVDGQVTETTVPVDRVPQFVELDPDYHVFRKVPPDRIVPTTAATRSGPALATVLPRGDVPRAYRHVQEIFESSFDPPARKMLAAGTLTEGALADRCVLILGDAARDPYVQGFLTAIDFPVSFVEGGFEFAGVSYLDPGDAVLCTAAHPGVPGGGVTVLYANSDTALPGPAAVPMYDRSLVIFNASRAILREDFEPPNRIPVERR